MGDSGAFGAESFGAWTGLRGFFGAVGKGLSGGNCEDLFGCE